MAQPSVASYFNSRKRTAIGDVKLNQARKVLILDPSTSTTTKVERLSKEIIFAQVPQTVNDEGPGEKLSKLQEEQEKIVTNNKIVVNDAMKPAPRKQIRAGRGKKLKPVTNNKDIQELFSKINQPPKNELTPPSTPTKCTNAMDKVRADGPSLKEIKNKMLRSSRLAEMKASMARFQEADKKLSDIEQVTNEIPDSPKLNRFRNIELEVMTSPQKLFSPEKAYLSPKKDVTGVRKNLLNLMSPTKNAISFSSASPSKELLSETSKPALTLPFKYRFLAEMFRSLDTVIQIMYNRKETITFRKLKPAVEEMIKRNLLEKHLAQIKTIYPEAFKFTQEKLKVFGSGMRSEQWELVVQPNCEGDTITSDTMLQRRRKLFNLLLDRVKRYHEEFLQSLDAPISIPKDKVTRWHPEFNIEKVPDIELSPLPQPPNDDKLTSGKDVLEKARVMFSCNTRMENALKKLKEAQEKQDPLSTPAPTPELPQSVLKGIPKALLEKVRQKQAAKALVSMTRSANKEKEVQIYARLPELARLTRNVFVAEKKGCLPLETLVDKLGNSHKGNLNKTELENHIKIIAKEMPSWLAFHDIRNCVYVKIMKNADLSVVVSKLEELCKQKNET